MVGFASLWIGGLAVILSALGFADYHAAVGGRKFRQEVRRPGYQAAINFGLTTFSLGQLGSWRAWWEIVLWGVLAAAFAGYTFAALRRLRREGEELTDIDPARHAGRAGHRPLLDSQAATKQASPGSPAARSGSGVHSILLVCTGNRCRSPMAAVLLRHLLERKGLGAHYRIETAGTWAEEGQPALPEAQAVMRERGLDLSQHRSRRVSADLLHAFDLVLVMEAGHREALQVEYPELGARLQMLTAMAGSAYSLRDPAGDGLTAYRALADELATVLGCALPCIRQLLE